MRIGIYDPYLDTLGGGEKYILDIAVFLSKNHIVDVFWDTSQQKTLSTQAKKQFDIDLHTINFVENIFTSQISLIKRFFLTRKYDVILFVSDGSIPLLGAKRNILLLQFSVNWVQSGLKEKIKLHFIQDVICYSQFVKEYIDKTFGISSIVIPPSIKLLSAKNAQKENIILTVGRFTRAMNEKKQLFQIKAFKKLIDSGIKGWKFILIGSHLPKDGNFIDELKKEIGTYPIEILPNVSQETLIQYYQKAKIYWHAAGFGEDLSIYPERAEHFGMTTVEAMSTGAVPVVFNGGGQKEIISDTHDGFLWNTEEQLLEETTMLINDFGVWKKVSEKAEKKADIYSENIFTQKIAALVA